MEKPQKRGPGRPPGKTNFSREVILRVRMSEEEHAVVSAKARAREMPVSTWARDTLLSALR